MASFPPLELVCQECGHHWLLSDIVPADADDDEECPECSSTDIELA